MINIVKTFKNKKPADWMEVMLYFHVSECVVKPLTHICNQSLQAGLFPSKMKTAEVTEIYEVGDRRVLSNYRHVSLLSQFSGKIFY